jgi:ferric-chelate reductase [NAD(P)H]
MIVGDLGCPLVTEHAVSVLEAKVFDSVDVGTHTVFAAEVVGGKVLSDRAPLTYAMYHASKGKAPKNAPTYTGVEPPNAPTSRGRGP